MRELDLGALALLVAIGGACGPTASPPSDEGPELGNRFEEAFNTGDVDGLAALFAEDVRHLPAGFEPREGREAITAVFREFMEEVPRMDSELIETVVAGDIGWQVATRMVERPDVRFSASSTSRLAAGRWSMEDHQLDLEQRHPTRSRHSHVAGHARGDRCRSVARGLA